MQDVAQRQSSGPRSCRASHTGPFRQTGRSDLGRKPNRFLVNRLKDTVPQDDATVDDHEARFVAERRID